MFKNTILLYFRMALMMLINLFTSRVVLQTLGVEDYGIYNVVGGVVVMFTFLNDGMTTSTLRFLTFELGKGNQQRLKEVFATSLHIHLIISAVIVLLCETFGLWFLMEKMVIPAERMTAAHWCYQLSIFTMVVTIMSYPYNAAIIAHEKMSAFAYISILDAILKLLLVYLLLAFSMDRLILYAILFAAEKVLIRMVYNIYCTRHFEECHYQWRLHKPLFRQMFTFAGWSMWGNLACIGFTQGLNMLLNVFFGPAVNAARAVAIQVQSTVSQVASNFQMAINPQITKTHASGQSDETHSLIFRSTRFTFCLLLMMCLPIVVEAPMLLELWLGEVPDYAVPFVMLLLTISLVEQSTNPLATAVMATGDIKKYELVNGTLMMMIVPVAYVVLRMGGAPWTVFLVYLMIAIIASVVRFFIASSLIQLSGWDFFTHALSRCLLVLILSCITPLLMISLLGSGIVAGLLTFAMTLIATCLISFLVGLNKEERTVILARVVKKFNKVQ
jgi:O-antigen/teichoic acid export membrane protein